MSGGVDSSVATRLLADKVCSMLIPPRLLLNKRQDYNLSAVYMRNWDTRDEERVLSVYRIPEFLYCLPIPSACISVDAARTGTA